MEITAGIIFVSIGCALWVGYSIILLFKLIVLILSEALKALLGRSE